MASLLIDWGGDVSAANISRKTPLLVASQGGHDAVARELIDRGADVSAANIYTQTPLHLAMEKEHEAVVPLLADHRASFDSEQDVVDEAWQVLRKRKRVGSL